MEVPGPDPLAVSLAAGDQRAFAGLYDRLAGRLYRAAMGMLGHHEDAEDTLQEVFGGLVTSRRQLADVQDLTAYVFAALRRAAGRCAARRAREPRVLETAAAQVPASPEGSSNPSSPYSDRLERALTALPEEQREVIVLKIDGALTFAQIAEVLGVSANTAASRYRYALEKLRASLGKGKQ